LPASPRGPRGSSSQSKSTRGYGAFSLDDRLLATAGGGDTILVWDVDSGNKVRKIRSKKASFQRFLPGGRLFAAGPRTASTLWDVKTGRQMTVPAGILGQWGIAEAQISADGGRLAWRVGNKVTVWDLEANRSLATIDLGGPDSANEGSYALSPDGNVVAAAGIEVTLWEVATGQARRSLKSMRTGGTWLRLAISPDGKLLAAAEETGFLALVEIETGSLLGKLKAHGDWPLGVAFSADGATLVSAEIGEVRLWNVAALRARPDLR
jgi:WD40 repeat protein